MLLYQYWYTFTCLHTHTHTHTLSAVPISLHIHILLCNHVLYYCVAADYTAALLELVFVVVVALDDMSNDGRCSFTSPKWIFDAFYYYFYFFSFLDDAICGLPSHITRYWCLISSIFLTIIPFWCNGLGKGCMMWVYVKCGFYDTFCTF